MNKQPPLPRYTIAEIYKVADEMREHYAAGELPVDVLAMIEFDLEMDLRPVVGLKNLYGMDALIMSKMDVVYVDQSELMDDNLANRLRFSMAHELGHRALHREYYEAVGVTKLEDAYDFIDSLSEPSYDQLEWQASEFAGRLLVSPDRLVVECQKLIDSFQKEILELNVDCDIILEQSVPRLARTFGISESALSRRIVKWGIADKLDWPTD